MQTTSNILMIRPVAFGLNMETAESNAFQDKNASKAGVQENALKEFDDFVIKLQHAGVNVTVINDTEKPHTPDSIFPNNWVSFHEDGTIFTYPMLAENRRKERREEIIDVIQQKFLVNNINDLTGFESQGLFLEGTGSMVLDRENKLAYACLSSRTAKKILEIFCKETGYEPVTFTALDENGKEIYHTNVMMCVGDFFAVVCLACIADEKERTNLKTVLSNSGKEIVDITTKQMNQFAGNMLQLKNSEDKSLLIMSERAFLSLSSTQVNTLNKYATIIHSSLETIENNGGGSARCMIAEIHLPTKHS